MNEPLQDQTRENAGEMAAPAGEDGLHQGGRSGILRLLTLLICGALGGVLAWVLLQQFGGTFKLPPELANADAMGPADIFAESLVQRVIVQDQNAILSMALIGLALSVPLAVGKGLADGSMRRALTGLGIGILAGAGFGALGGYLETIINAQLISAEPGLRAMASFAVAWLCCGVGVGLAVGIPTLEPRRIGRSVFAAAVGGGLAAVVYVPLAGVLFPFSNAENIVPAGTGNRLLWTLLPGLLMALVLARAELIGKRNPAAVSTAEAARAES